MMLSAVEGVLAPFDRARRSVLVGLGPVARALVRDRELRVAAVGVSVALTSFAGACLLPLAILALGPLVFGVPHLLADVRYLVVQRGLHRRPELMLPALPLVAVALGAEPADALLAPVLAALVARGRPARRALVAGVAALVVALVAGLGRDGTLLVVHGHNLVAVAVWWAWRARARRLHHLPLAAFVLGALAVAAGLGDAALADGAPGWPEGLRAEDYLATLVPTAASPVLGARLVVFFAYAQAVHYGVWVRLVPEDARPRPAPRSFTASYRALGAELGFGCVNLVAAVAIGLAAWAAVDLTAARLGYQDLAAFHGYLELTVLALALAERTPLGPEGRGRAPWTRG